MRTLSLLVGMVLAAAPLHGEDAAMVFRDRCQSCHTPPDPHVDTDRMWLDRLRDTG